MKESITKLKQARVNADVSLKDMAYLLDADASNLSKFERGLKPTPLPIVLGYFAITQSTLPKLFSKQVQGVIELVSSRLTNLIDQLENENGVKHISRIKSLYNSLNNLSCLQDVSQKSHEER